MSRRVDTSSTTCMAKLMGKHWRSRGTSWTKLGRSLLGWLVRIGWEKVPNWECMFVHRKQGLFLSFYVDDVKMAGKKQNLAPMWKKLMKNVDMDEPTSFLDHVYLGCTHRECKPNETIIEQYTKMFESRISAGAAEKFPGWKKPHARTAACSYDMEGNAQKRVQRYCELANKKVEQLYKVSHLCLDDHQFKQEELESVGELSEVCSHIVLKCLYLARIGRLDFLWSVNKLARSVTKWTQACDRRLARLISYIHHTNDFHAYCHVGNTAQHCRLGLFQDSDFSGDLEDSKSTSGGVLCILGSRTFCSHKLDVQEANVSVSQNRIFFSLDAGLRLDGLPAVDLWDVVIEVLHSSKNTESPTPQVQGNISRNPNTNQQPSYSRLKTSVSRHIDQMVRTRKFKARNERIETGVIIKSQQWRKVSVERKVGERFQWKATGHCLTGDSCSFRHDPAAANRLRSETRRTIVLSCTKSEGTDWRADTLKKFQAAERREPIWNKRTWFRAEISWRESVRIRRVIFDTLPCV